MNNQPSFDVWVTGATGFLGSRLVQSLADDGWSVLATDRNRNAATGDAMGAGRNIRFVPGDLRDAEAMAGHVRAIVHLASYVPPSHAIPWREDLDTCLGGIVEPTVGLLKSIQGRCDHFILGSSVSVYGTREGRVGPDVVPNPDTFYAACKLLCESLCQVAAQQLGMRFAALRMTQIWGVGEPHGIFVQRGFLPAAKNGRPITVTKGGRQRVNLLWVDDAVAAIQAALKAEISGVHDIVHPAEISVLELAKMFQAHSGHGLPVEVQDNGEAVANKSYDWRGAQGAFGFKAAVSYEEGVRRLLR